MLSFFQIRKQTTPHLRRLPFVICVACSRRDRDGGDGEVYGVRADRAEHHG